MSPHTPYNLGPDPGGYHTTPGMRPGPYPVPVPPPKRRHTGLIVLAALLVVALCGAGVVVVALAATSPPAKDGYRAAQGTPPAGSSAGAPAPAPPPPPPAKAKTTIDDGTWTAGVDFPPGRYEVTATAKLCAWQVYTGQEPNVTYVDPGHVGAGHYAFTFQAGQHLLTQGCGTWAKVG